MPSFKPFSNPEASGSSPLRAQTPVSGINNLPSLPKRMVKPEALSQEETEPTRIYKIPSTGVSKKSVKLEHPADPDSEVTRVKRPELRRPVFEDEGEEVTRVQKAPVQRTLKSRSESGVRARRTVDTSEAKTRIVHTPIRRVSVPETRVQEEVTQVREAPKKRLPSMPSMPRMTDKEYEKSRARAREKAEAEAAAQAIAQAEAEERARLERYAINDKARMSEIGRQIKERFPLAPPVMSPSPEVVTQRATEVKPAPRAVEVHVERTALGSMVDKVKGWFTTTFGRKNKSEVTLPPGVKVSDLEDLTSELDS